MLTEKELEKALDLIQSRLDTVNTLFIRKVAEQIKTIGELGQANINRLVIMADMGADIAEVNQQLMEATGLNMVDLQKVYEAAMEDTYTDPRFKRVLDQTPLPPEAKERLAQYTRSVYEQTAQTMENLSNTTAVSDPYKAAVDTAITAVTSGLMDYGSATRSVIRSLGYNGLQVRYESGYHRRLDTAVRQNIVDGANQISQNGAKMLGEELGYDAYEISAHLHSAPDHEPVQGRVLLKEEYDKMQSGEDFEDVDGRHFEGFKRPIAEWNCMHFALPFSTKHSVRRYTDDQIREWNEKNDAGCEIDGKHYSIYKASQLMRETETEVRRWKDTANAARIAGDETLRRQCQQHINALGNKYTQIVKASGLPSRRERMAVEGFRMVKLKAQ